MAWDAAAPFDLSKITNPNGDPLFHNASGRWLKYGDIGMSQRLPDDPKDIVGGVNSRSDTTLTTTRVGPTSGREIKALPLTIANMYDIASVRLAKEFRKLTHEYNLRNEAQEAPPLVAMPKQLTSVQTELILQDIAKNGNTGNIVLTVGSDHDSRTRMQSINEHLHYDKISPHSAIKIIHFDSPNLNTPEGFESLIYWREQYPEAYFIAGNTNNPETARHIAECGADAVKIGIGPGGMCTTSLKSGIAVPQVTAVASSVFALQKDDGSQMAHIIADGGIRHPRDWAHALGLGATEAWVGTLFGGDPLGFETDEDFEKAKFKLPTTRLERIIDFINGTTRPWHVRIIGSASDDAQKRYHKDRNKDNSTAEGRAAAAPVEEDRAKRLWKEFTGGGRSTLAFRAASTIEEFRKHAQFGEMSGHVDHSVHTKTLHI